MNDNIYCPPTRSISLNMVEWEVILENLHQGALRFESKTLKESKGLRELEDRIRNEINGKIDDGN